MFNRINIGLRTPDLHSEIQIALANIPVLENQIEASYLGNPIITKKRFKVLSGLLNSISGYRGHKGKRINLLVFPEVSVPYLWESTITAWSRKHNIGVICGLEHKIKNNRALNEVLTALPYKTINGLQICLPIKRLKRWYSPEEIFKLEKEGFRIPKSKDPYQLIRWRGVSFAVYNCYELASIEDRSIFKGKIDFIVATEVNQDVNYFSNIVESAARDLHCYVIQVNESKFGDSRIVAPAKTEKMNPLRIKGGENVTFLTMRLNLRELRDYQRKGYGLQKDSKFLKPTPPGLNKDDVMERIRLGLT